MVLSLPVSPANGGTGTGRPRVDPILSRSLALIAASAVLYVLARVLDPEPGVRAARRLAGGGWLLALWPIGHALWPLRHYSW